MDIQTTLLVVKLFLLALEFDSSVVDGPSACLPWARPEVGGVCTEVGAPKNGGAEGGFVEDVGGGEGATLVLNRLPSFLHDQTSLAGRSTKFTIEIR